MDDLELNGPVEISPQVAEIKNNLKNLQEAHLQQHLADNYDIDDMKEDLKYTNQKYEYPPKIKEIDWEDNTNFAIVDEEDDRKFTARDASNAFRESQDMHDDFNNLGEDEASDNEDHKYNEDDASDNETFVIKDDPGHKYKQGVLNDIIKNINDDKNVNNDDNVNNNVWEDPVPDSYDDFTNNPTFSTNTLKYTSRHLYELKEINDIMNIPTFEESIEILKTIPKPIPGTTGMTGLFVNSLLLSETAHSFDKVPEVHHILDNLAVKIHDSNALLKTSLSHQEKMNRNTRKFAASSTKKRQQKFANKLNKLDDKRTQQVKSYVDDMTHQEAEQLNDYVVLSKELDRQRDAYEKKGIIMDKAYYRKHPDEKPPGWKDEWGGYDMLEQQLEKMEKDYAIIGKIMSGEVSGGWFNKMNIATMALGAFISKMSGGGGGMRSIGY
jgi:hypothetical protein